MADFSVETAVEEIVDPRTKEYFREVHSSYAIGNTRPRWSCSGVLSSAIFSTSSTT